MRHAGRSKYSREEIQKALAKLQAGQSLSDVARETGASKFTIAYWISRASKFMPGESAEPASFGQQQQDFVAASWKNLARVNRHISQKLDEATFSELIRLLESLSEILGRMGPSVQLQIRAKMNTDSNEFLKSRVIVQEYLRKEREKKDVDGEPLEQNKGEARQEG